MQWRRIGTLYREHVLSPADKVVSESGIISSRCDSILSRIFTLDRKLLRVPVQMMTTFAAAAAHV